MEPSFGGSNTVVPARKRGRQKLGSRCSCTTLKRHLQLYPFRASLPFSRMNTTIRSKLFRPTIGALVLLVAFSCLSLPLRARVPDDPKAKEEMRNNLERDIRRIRQALDANPQNTNIQQELARAEAVLKMLNGGAGGAAPAKTPPRKKPAPVRPDPNNPWTLPGAMWTQKGDGSYEYYRLEKDKSGRNVTVVVIPTVSASGRVTWTDKK